MRIKKKTVRNHGIRTSVRRTDDEILVYIEGQNSSAAVTRSKPKHASRCCWRKKGTATVTWRGNVHGAKLQSDLVEFKRTLLQAMTSAAVLACANPDKLTDEEIVA